jgi:hypothetical protein
MTTGTWLAISDDLPIKMTFHESSTGFWMVEEVLKNKYVYVQSDHSWGEIETAVAFSSKEEAQLAGEEVWSKLTAKDV